MRRFAFRLASHLSMTVGDLLDRMTAEEFIEWMILEAIDPFGDRRADVHNGLIRQMLAACNSKNVPSLKTFLEVFEVQPPVEEEKSAERLLEIMLGLAETSKQKFLM